TVGPSVGSAMTPPGCPRRAELFLAIAWQTVATGRPQTPWYPIWDCMPPPSIGDLVAVLRHICLRTLLSKLADKKRFSSGSRAGRGIVPGPRGPRRRGPGNLRA